MTAVAVHSKFLAAAATTASTSYVDVTAAMAGLTASTKYLLIVQACIGGDNVSNTFGFQIVERDTGETDLVVPNSEMIREPSNATKSSDYAWSGIVTTRSGGADSGFMFQQKAVSSGTAKVDYVSIVAIDLSELTEGSDYFVSDNSASATHTTSSVQRVSHELSSANAKDNSWLIMGFMQTDSNNSINSAEIVMKEVATSSGTTTMYTALFESEDLTEQLQHVLSYGKAYTVDETVTYSLWSRDDAGIVGFNEYIASSIVGLRLNVFEQYNVHYDATPDLDNDNSFNSRFTGSITPDTTGTFVFVGTMIARLKSVGRILFERLLVDTKSTPNSLLEETNACRTYNFSDLIPVNVVATAEATADIASTYEYQFKEAYTGTGVNGSGLVVFSTEISSAITYNVIVTESTASGDDIAQTHQAGNVATETL